MKLKGFINTFLKTGTSLALAAGFLIAGSTVVNAQRPGQTPGRDDRPNQTRPNDRPDQNRRDDRGINQQAYQRGYSAGLAEGKKDAQKRRTRSMQSFKSYRNATSGYSSRMGNKAEYQCAYREGFERGYNEANKRNNGRQQPQQGPNRSPNQRPRSN